MKCSKCNGEMEEGIVVPTNFWGLGGGFGSAWGTKVNAMILTIENKKEAKTYRCKTCGYLESYAK